MCGMAAMELSKVRTHKHAWFSALIPLKSMVLNLVLIAYIINYLYNPLELTGLSGSFYQTYLKN